MTIEERTGVLKWTPSIGQLGVHAVSIEVTDTISSDIQSFYIIVWEYPNASIIVPKENASYMGSMDAKGSYVGPLGTKILYQIDENEWSEVDTYGDGTWTIHLNFSSSEKGNHVLRIKAIWKENSSNIQAVRYTVKEKKENSLELLIFLIIIIIIILSVIAWENYNLHKNIEKEKKIKKSKRNKMKKV
jgi:hypothetical protein